MLLCGHVNGRGRSGEGGVVMSEGLKDGYASADGTGIATLQTHRRGVL